jgi:hypothetical protein
MSSTTRPGPAWPELAYHGHEDELATLHLWTQVVGKLRLARTPWLNHSWHVPLYVTARGLGTGLIPHEACSFQADFDFVDHQLELVTTDGGRERLRLEPRSVADFHGAVLGALERLGVPVTIHPVPNEIPDAIPFHEDTRHAAYDPDLAHRLWQALVRMERVFQSFRTRFLGKSSPVHFFWGSFDLAVTRFSGRPAPLHPGGVPNLPDAVAREAYSHEVSSAGFWPGGGGVDEPCFYSYAYPEPEGFTARSVQPAEARYHAELGEFVLPYAAVRSAADPAAALASFLESTYEAAAETAGWDRDALECPRGRLGVPRPLA